MCKRKDVSERHWGDDENCCMQCLGCLARVPCATLTAWVFMVVSVATCTGSLMIGTEKAREVLEQDDNFLGKMTIICICVLFGMVFVSTLFLMVALVSTGRTSKQLFDSIKKNYCARALNIVSIIVMILLQLTWIILCCVLFIPILFFSLVHLLHEDRGFDCINLKHYGITVEDKEFCGEALDHLYYKSKEVMICLGISFLAAILAAICMTLFMVFASANIIYLKEGRFATYNVYRNGISHDTSRGPSSYVDTKM